MRRALGRLIEWLLSYEHEVVVEVGPGVKLPYHKYPGDAGYDLFASERVRVLPGRVAEVPAGLRMDPKARVWFEIKARSSTLKSKGLEVVDAVIDRDYRGEMLAVVRNPTGLPVTIEPGERVVQIIPHRLIPVAFKEGRLSRSPRGESGFGSTGR